MRGERPFVFTNLKTGQGLATVMDTIIALGGLAPADGRARACRRAMPCAG
jgi:hypothetical protein